MKLPRRQFLHLAAGAATFPTVTRMVRADPTRPVHIVVGYSVGLRAYSDVGHRPP
jgi:hypothetical protein